MANAEKILCPGCGAEMKLAPLADFGLLYGFQYHCPRCGWDSPLMQTEREARDMAGKRVFTPPARCWECREHEDVPYPAGEVYCNVWDVCVPCSGYCHCGMKKDGGASDAF